MQKKKGNTDYEERIHQSDLRDHEYAGIEHISNFSNDDLTKVSSVSENINPHNTVRDGHYEETSTSPNENDHEYAELKMVQMKNWKKDQVILKPCTDICDQIVHDSY